MDLDRNRGDIILIAEVSMTDLLVRDMNPKTVARLKAQAHQHGRSLQAELRAILEREAALQDTTAWEAWLQDFRSRTAGRWGDESLDLLRESRDER